MSSHLDEIKSTIINGQHKDIEGLVESALTENIDAERIVNEAMIPAMDVVGEKFSTKEIFVP